MTSVPVPICYSCAHLDRDLGMVCDAFPAGIPQSILLSETDHRLPYPGDHGIQFELDPTAPIPDTTALDTPVA